jgi:hypothetical protein
MLLEFKVVRHGAQVFPVSWLEPLGELPSRGLERRRGRWPLQAVHQLQQRAFVIALYRLRVERQQALEHTDTVWPASDHVADAEHTIAHGYRGLFEQLI